MQDQEQARGCVLFADVSGSTKLYEAVGDSAAHAAIDMCVKLFASITLKHQGRVIKTIGDEVMSVFSQGTDAARAAVEMQTDLSELAPVGNVRMGVRIGLHFGPIVEREGDIFGDTVNLASRLTEMAARNQIITSLETVNLLEPLLKMDCRRLYSIPVKGKAEEVSICEVLWSGTDDETTLATRTTARTSSAAVLRLVYGEKTIRLPLDCRSLVLGRDATADLVIPDRMASRAHCEVEQRQNKFIVIDRSANGTWITVDGEPPVILRREEAMLRGKGSITLGHSLDGATEIVQYHCE
ncbi:adenylate/guanylate cyclase domain-containing protein [Usitatibacter palustris]|uniref:Adenylate cyclase, class 3 n=1 Tax=Usitatibacter palustris TaxID=2732487 RepID=A0A6M4HDJ6_9PROT|nr:adenylate/guanylate cyclase domain-containing protein [Usitatibacter palustris]QJR16808.1 hypothetical protein DSM104440_03644 [Usitatibacter palustris]